MLKTHGAENHHQISERVSYENGSNFRLRLEHRSILGQRVMEINKQSSFQLGLQQFSISKVCDQNDKNDVENLFQSSTPIILCL